MSVKSRKPLKSRPARGEATEDDFGDSFVKSSPRSSSSQVVRGKQLVRVTGGAMRSRRLHFPAMPGLRPTPDRVRETLFNWLGQDLSGWRVLDVFAGSGILGIESLSRGAQWVGFIEQSTRVAAEIRANLNTLSITDERACVWSQDALGWLRQASTQVAAGERIDLVFLDPPFARIDVLSEAVERLQQADWLSDDAYMYIEQSAQEKVIEPVGWTRLREGRAGESAFALWRREKAEPSGE